MTDDFAAPDSLIRVQVENLAAHFPVTDAMLEDGALVHGIEDRMRAGLRRVLLPSDPNPMPRFRLFRWLPR